MADLVHVVVTQRRGGGRRRVELPDMPPELIPQVGDHVLGEGGQWWRVEVRAWSSYESPAVAAVTTGATRAWVDLVVAPVHGDPRQ